MDLVILFAVAVVSLVFIHEFGHFFAARLAGVRVDSVLVGVGPVVHRVTGRDQTEWLFSILPATQVRFNRVSFGSASPPRRIFVACAGSAANFAVTLVCFLLTYLFFPHPTAPVVELDTAEVLGQTSEFRQGDRIVAVDGVDTSDWHEVGEAMVKRIGDTGTLTIEVLRDNEPFEIAVPIHDWQSEKARISAFEGLGIRPATSAFAPRGDLIGRVFGAVSDTISMGIACALAGFKMVFADMSILNFGGGLQLTLLGAERDNLTAGHYLLLFGLISMCFGIINLLPGPVVDGLDVITASVEWVKGSPLGATTEKVFLILGSIFAFGPLPLCITYEALRYW